MWLRARPPHLTLTFPGGNPDQGTSPTLRHPVDRKPHGYLLKPQCLCFEMSFLGTVSTLECKFSGLLQILPAISISVEIGTGTNAAHLTVPNPPAAVGRLESAVST